MAVNLPSGYWMKNMAKGTIRPGRAANSTRSRSGVIGHLSEEQEEVSLDESLCVATRAFTGRRRGRRQVYRRVFPTGECTGSDNTPQIGPWFFGGAGGVSHRRIPG